MPRTAASAIIDAARTLFARNGFHGTGTSDIAAAAGCSEPVIYKHFASKQALFVAVLEDSALYMRERFAAATEGADDSLRRLPALRAQPLGRPEGGRAPRACATSP